MAVVFLTPARRGQVTGVHVGIGAVEERSGIVDDARRWWRVAKQAVEVSHEDGDAAASLRCARVAAEDVER